MQAVGADLQAVIFQALDREAELAARFSMLADGTASPQFSYDGMESQWHDRTVGLVSHQIGFSIWGPQAGFADGDDLAAQLIDALSGLSIAPPHQLVRLRLQTSASGFDGTARLWRQRLTFSALTASALHTA